MPYVGHATITDLGVISIKNLVKLVAGWKVFVESLKKFLGKVCLHVHAVRGFKPNNASFSPFGIFVAFWVGSGVVLNWFFVAVGFQCFVVKGCRVVENILAGGYVAYTFTNILRELFDNVRRVVGAGANVGWGVVWLFVWSKHSSRQIKCYVQEVNFLQVGLYCNVHSEVFEN